MVERNVTSRGLHGTEAQKALQATALADAPSARVRPGAVFAVRMRGTDNPERLGWDKIMKALSEDGAFAFRMIPAVQCAKVEQRLGEAGYRIDWWNVFEGEADDVLSAIEAVLVSPDPDFSVLPAPDDINDPMIGRVQDFMSACGIAAFPASVLTGDEGPAALSVLVDANGAIAATAFAHFPYNRFSRHCATAWCGLVGVREDLRRRGFGARVNAITLERAVRNLGAYRVQEFARRTNAASRSMIERCGLRLNEVFRAGIAQPVRAARFTR